MSQADNKPWRTLGSRIVYENPWLKVHEDKTQMPNGKEGIYGFIEGGSGIFIIALNKENEMYLIESFRHPTQKWQWELPTGGIEKGSTPLETAKNELAEELGITAKKWTPLKPYMPSHNGFMNDTQYVFVAEDLEVGEQHLGEFEAIRTVKTVSFKNLMQMVRDGELMDGQSLAALMQFVAWRETVGS
jgi:8-oxo-dGTP pyrophosphatase MutT (NUDIX family)